MTDSMAATFDRLREAAAAHDKPVGSCAAGPSTGRTDPKGGKLAGFREVPPLTTYATGGLERWRSAAPAHDPCPWHGSLVRR
jgi:hypothetical protein